MKIYAFGVPANIWACNSGGADFRVANRLCDRTALQEARKAASQLLQPTLLYPRHRALRFTMLRRWQTKLDLADVG